MDPINLINRKVGDGKETLFWKDLWHGEGSFETKFPKLYQWEPNKECTVQDRMARIHNNGGWDWSSNLREGELGRSWTF